ncbi:hydrogen peroxide-inducible genes activator [Sulfitobacter aestuariivivens]|uniref:Hydrogen peroxide-inducible genes activator n=1 Tax=Sulfitobacter aestuariivivens TaxID=2766981 RepID=A0A927D5D4_9RHOB|nr:hydrogen peroxide-inducible genes activator [Sulfitobacter aestuariivivens]MBD3664124.1 hydrogen peroxide-inducible genes activator [Sulfitobacter aestuariivivens]
MTNLTLKQMRYFEALAEHRHFGNAAAVCAISQPALSVQIKEMERELGTSLFERSARQVRLTHFGEALAVRVRDILRSVDELGDFARTAQGKLVGRFRLGIIPTIAPYLLPQVLRNLSQSHPGLDIHVRETLTPRLVQELTQGKIDCALVALPVTAPGLAEMPLFDEDFLLVRPATEQKEPAPGPEDLRQMRLLLLEEGHCFREQALAFCNTGPKLPRDGLDGSSLATLVQMVGAGIGVTMIPSMAKAVETRSAAVDCTRFKGQQPSRTIGMVWRKTSPLERQLRDIAMVVKQAGTVHEKPVAQDAFFEEFGVEFSNFRRLPWQWYAVLIA